MSGSAALCSHTGRQEQNLTRRKEGGGRGQTTSACQSHDRLLEHSVRTEHFCYLVSVWYLSGICLVSAWYLSGICLVSVWYLSGICLVSAWYLSGICLVSVCTHWAACLSLSMKAERDLTCMSSSLLSLLSTSLLTFSSSSSSSTPPPLLLLLLLCLIPPLTF